MENKIKYLLIIMTLFLYNIARAQRPTDTLNYLVDTAKTPVRDRMFDISREGDYYGYQLACKCLTWQNDAVFTYRVDQKGTVVSPNDLKKMNLSNLTRLIYVAKEFGIYRRDKTVFNFIEKIGDQYIKHRVYLLEPRKNEIAY
jgi:hypothetical protein